MSFNIRFGEANDGDNHWKFRKEMVADVINDFSPDLLGLQEALAFQSEFIGSKIAGYQYFGRSRMKTPNEHCGIFFRESRFTKLAGGHFWLSEFPEQPESKSWDSSLPRMATWLLLHDEERPSGSAVLMLNTHFDHRGSVARQESAKIIANRIQQLRKLANDPIVIITGDFNTGEATAPYNALIPKTDAPLSDTYRVVFPVQKDDEGTFNSWRGTNHGARIDWILTGGPANVLSAEIIRTSHDGRYPSDHYPVAAVIQPR